MKYRYIIIYEMTKVTENCNVIIFNFEKGLFTLLPNNSSADDHDSDGDSNDSDDEYISDDDDDDEYTSDEDEDEEEEEDDDVEIGVSKLFSIKPWQCLE
jgi:hypothetical protein